MRRAVPSGDTPDIEQHVAVGIGVTQLHPRARVAYLDAKLLVQLAFERRQHRFAGLALAAREFPLAALVAVGVPAGDENLAAVEEQADRDVVRN